MSIFGSNCGCNNGNDCTILWFIILFLLIFSGDGLFGGRNSDCGCERERERDCDCGCN